MAVAQYTTPTFLLSFSQQGLDLTAAHNVYVTFASGAYVLTKSGEDLDIGEKTIGVYMNQSETGKFRPGDILIQANWTTLNGDRTASEKAKIRIDENLLKRVVE